MLVSHYTLRVSLADHKTATNLSPSLGRKHRTSHERSRLKEKGRGREKRTPIFPEEQ
jgi:hypothetical protein